MEKEISEAQIVRIQYVPVKTRRVASASTKACRSSVSLPSEHKT
jgi:hypothetical protein